MELIGVHITGGAIDVTFIARAQKKEAIINSLKGSNLKYEEVEVTPDMLRNRSFRIL
jgi:hypothetical protein